MKMTQSTTSWRRRTNQMWRIIETTRPSASPVSNSNTYTHTHRHALLFAVMCVCVSPTEKEVNELMEELFETVSVSTQQPITMLRLTRESRGVTWLHHGFLICFCPPAEGGPGRPGG